MELEKSILNYIKKQGFVFNWYMGGPNNNGSDLLGYVISNRLRKEIALSGWATFRLSLEDKRYIVALLMAHYELCGKGEGRYLFKIESLQEIANFNKGFIEFANEIVEKRILLER